MKKISTYAGVIANAGYHINELYKRTDHLLDVAATMYNYIGEMPVSCDKCSNYENPDYHQICYKCESTGVIKHKQLFNWPQ